MSAKQGFPPSRQGSIFSSLTPRAAVVPASKEPALLPAKFSSLTAVSDFARGGRSDGAPYINWPSVALALETQVTDPKLFGHLWNALQRGSRRAGAVEGLRQGKITIHAYNQGRAPDWPRAREVLGDDYDARLNDERRRFPDLYLRGNK